MAMTVEYVQKYVQGMGGIGAYGSRGTKWTFKGRTLGMHTIYKPTSKKVCGMKGPIKHDRLKQERNS